MFAVLCSPQSDLSCIGIGRQKLLQVRSDSRLFQLHRQWWPCAWLPRFKFLVSARCHGSRTILPTLGYLLSLLSLLKEALPKCVLLRLPGTPRLANSRSRSACQPPQLFLVPLPSLHYLVSFLYAASSIVFWDHRIGPIFSAPLRFCQPPRPSNRCLSGHLSCCSRTRQEHQLASLSASCRPTTCPLSPPVLSQPGPCASFAI